VRPYNDGAHVKRSLIALSSAAVLGVYGAGYVKTRAAAERFADQSGRRRPAAAPVPAIGPAPATPAAQPATASTAPPADVAPTVPAAASGSSTSEPATQAVATAAKVTLNDAPAPAKPAAASPAAAVDRPTAAGLPAVAALGVTTGAALSSLPTMALPTAPAVPPGPQYADGTYKGWGTCRHGDIEAEVVITDGKIASAKVSQCWTRYSCSWISPLPPQVVKRQSPETDYVSGATESTNAFYYAVVEALKVAKKK
jgi:uncharacterized protein with FMN-binding domain